jgi:endonuclease/exonuclease/phosphatase family metal-dependent hydrolase
MAGTALFASYNVHKCVGTDRRFDPGRIAAVIAEISPDVLALQEADKRFGDRRGLLDLAALREATGLEPVPIANGHMGHGWHGNLLLTRGGATRQVRQVTLPGLEPRGALMADVMLEVGAIRVVGVHLGLLRHSRLLQVTSLISHAADATSLPVLMMGDMNEWRRERRSALLGFASGLGPVAPGVPSFPAYYPVLALDRMVARPAGILGPVEAHSTPLSRRASDHLPIKARVTFEAVTPAAAALEPAGPV